MKAKAPQLQKNVIEKLEAVLAELGHMQLPQGTGGSILLDAMEAMEQVRKTLRDEANGFLLREPKALPGWSLSLANGRGRREGPRREPGELMVIRQHHRAGSYKLIRQRLRRTGNGK
jgi:hypothetical protein